MKTAEQITAIAERRAQSPLGAIRIINREYRRQDESHLWPICGRFNATERAIRRVRDFMRHYGGLDGIEYAYALDDELSRIVNGEC